MITYETGKALKFTEQDVWTEGCLPETTQTALIDITFSANSIKELITKIKDFYNVKDDDLLLNACDENGRIDISILEDDNSTQADKHNIILWKQGKKRLWASIYSYNIEKVTRETVKI